MKDDIPFVLKAQIESCATNTKPERDITCQMMALEKALL